MMNTGQGSLSVAAGWASEPGPRPANEDYAAVRLAEPGEAAGVFAAIADGVGGNLGGRVAAEVTVRNFIDGCLGQSEALPVRQSAFRSIEAINRWIYSVGRTDAALSKMACTFTGVVLRRRRLHLLHVGDTRLYRLREGQLVQLTRDQRPEGGAMRNLLTRAVGAEESVRVDYLEEALEAHDRLLLCSDGLFETLGDRRLAEELGRRSGAEETARRLVEAALEAGPGDNVTALVLDVLQLPGADAADIGSAVDALPMVAPPAVGAVVDGFALTQVLADGRYSRVFRAQDAAAGQTVLLKFPKPEAPGAQQEARAAFLRETWVATRVRSPWIGEVVELPAGRQSALYLAQPYYEGETLEARLLRRPPVSVADGQDLALKLAKGVAALHRAGVIHRDIKPENIILQDDGGLKLIDLGVARLPHLEVAPSRDVPGTASYMAPELFAGAAADERTDLFALGVTLYRTFCGGAYPYGEIEPFSHPRFRRPSPLSAHRPDLPAWLETAIMRTVAADPAERPGDAVELAFELENGSVRAAPARPARQPLLERDPLRFWQAACLLLLLLLLWSLARG